MSEVVPPRILFLHSPSGRPSDFAGVAARLPARFASAAPPVAWDESRSPKELAARLAAELRADGRPAVLVAGGHAAYLALEVARRARPCVRGLVLSGCADDPKDGFGKADVPILLLFGTDDAITPPAVARRLRDALPDVRLLFVLEAGHEPLVDRPAAYAFHLVSFLNDLAPERVPPRRLVDEAA